MASSLCCRVGGEIVGNSCIPEKVENWNRTPKQDVDLISRRLARLKQEV